MGLDPNKQRVLIYGSYGFSGRLIVARALAAGLQPILAGRNGPVLRQQASECGLEYRAFALDDESAGREALQDVLVVMHCAGPFSRTSSAMVQRCIETGTHYTDISGEVSVFESLAARDVDAGKVGVMLLGGCGFDVVPTDCLAAYLKEEVPSATHLELGFHLVGRGQPTRGTLNSIVEGLQAGGRIRVDGKLKRVPIAWKSKRIDFGNGERLAVTIPWGDVSTAFHSTGIPNIAVYTAVPRSQLIMTRLLRLVLPLLRLRFVRNRVDALIARQPAGPDDATRARSTSLVWGTVYNENGASATARLVAPDAYELTGITAVSIIQHILGGDFKVGYQTPATVYGADFILEFDGVVRR